MVQNRGRPVIDFTDYITARTESFTGRKWVFRAVNDWLADPGGSRFFLLTGEPGSGKTAIASRLAEFSCGVVAPPAGLTHLTPHFLSALHLCSARDSRWINPYVFTDSLAMQLAERYPEYAKALAEKSGDRHIRIEVQQRIEQGQAIGVVIHQLDVSGVPPEDAFNLAVREPLEEFFQGGFNQPVVILVDALDESLAYSGDVHIVSLLSRLDNLPAGVRFLLTSRQDEHVEKAFLDTEELVISSARFDYDNQEDICQYVQDRLCADQRLARIAQVEPVRSAKLVETIPRKAEGNFLYVRFLLDAIAQGLQPLSNLEVLPQGLDELYFVSLKRVVERGKRDWSKEYAPLIGVLSVVQESLTLAQLQALTQQSKSSVLEYWRQLRQFIEEVLPPEEKEHQETKYRLYHQSVSKFLHREVLSIKKRKLKNTFYLPAEEWHTHVARVCEQEDLSILWKNVTHDVVEQGRREYARRYYLIHMYQAGQKQALRETLTDARYLEGKLRAEGANATLEDLELLREDKEAQYIAWVVRRWASLLQEKADEVTNQVEGHSTQRPVLHHRPWEDGRPYLYLAHPTLRGDRALVRVLTNSAGWLKGCALSADGRMALAIEGRARKIWVWDVESGQRLRGLGDYADCCALSADGRVALSSNQFDQAVVIWDIESGQVLRLLKGHKGVIHSCALSADGKIALSASGDLTLKVWNVQNGRVLHTLNGHTSVIHNCALSADGKIALSASDDQTLKVWDVQNGRVLHTLKGHTNSVDSCALSADGRVALSASFDRTLLVWDLTDKNSINAFQEDVLQGHTGPINGCALSVDGRVALSASDDQTLKVWDVKSGNVLHTLEGHTSEVRDCALSADGRVALSVSTDKTLMVWDVSSGQKLHTLEGQTDTMSYCALSADGRLALSANWKGMIEIWDVESGQKLRSWKTLGWLVRDCALSADGQIALSVEFVDRHHQMLIVWDVESGKVLRCLEGEHNYHLEGCALSADGRVALSASADTTLIVWDIESGQKLHRLRGHYSWVINCALSTDGRVAVSVSGDRTTQSDWDDEDDPIWGDRSIRVWDTNLGREIARWLHDHTLQSCALSADGHLVMVGDVRGGVHFLELRGTDMIPRSVAQELVSATPVLDRLRRAENVSDDIVQATEQQ
jgi:WD40 repeat protein